MSKKFMIEPGDTIGLQIAGGQMTFMASAGNGSDRRFHSTLSSVISAFDQDGLTEAGLENIIMLVEDLIAPILRSLPTGKKMVVSGTELEKVFHLLSDTSDVDVPIESVEILYHQLADYTAGFHVAWRQSSSPDSVALALVVLREVMQHGGFRSVSLRPHTE